MRIIKNNEKLTKKDKSRERLEIECNFLLSPVEGFIVPKIMGG